jgi:hypothetical protein
MNISFSAQPAFLRNREIGFVYAIRKYLVGEMATIATTNSTIQKKKQSLLINLTIILIYSKMFQWFLNLIISAVIVIGFAWLSPQAYYHFFPVKNVPLESQEAGSPLGGDFELGTSAVDLIADGKKSNNDYLPPKQDFLPEGDWLVIPRIGVRSELQATQNYQDALDTGLWLVPDFAKPGEYELPMIVAGHRYGWNWWWKDDYWKYNSFYLLPDVEAGDIVEVISDQRKWTYEIYAGEEGSQISDYDADLILYTCKYLSGPARYFRYARLIDLERDSQE